MAKNKKIEIDKTYPLNGYLFYFQEVLMMIKVIKMLLPAKI